MSITLIIILITGLISVYGFSNKAFFEKYLFSPYKIFRNKEYVRWLSYGFLHANWSHLLFNMLTLYFFGKYSEAIFAPSWVFILFYLSAIVISSIPDYIKNKNNAYYSAIGASGAVSAILFSNMLYAPWAILTINFIFPIPFIFFAIGYLAYSYYMNKQNRDNIGHSAHLTGAIYGMVATVVCHPESLNTFFYQLTHPPF